MKKIIFIALVLLMMVGCSTKDTPKFASGEATALVKQKLNQDINEMGSWRFDDIEARSPRYDMMIVKGTKSSDMQVFYAIQGQQCKDVKDEAKLVTFTFIERDSFSEEYLGGGVWDVTKILSQEDLNRWDAHFGNDDEGYMECL